MTEFSDAQTARLSELHELALRAAHHAYAPYSGFRVGSALLLENGAVFSGCNVENASYRLTNCAEENAIAQAVRESGPSIKIAAIVVVNLNNAVSMPCGACRQVILEFGSPDTLVAFPGEDGTRICSLDDLLPFGFRLQKP